MKSVFIFLLFLKLVVSFTATNKINKQISSTRPNLIQRRLNSNIHVRSIGKQFMTKKDDNDNDYSGNIGLPTDQFGSLVFVNDYLGIGIAGTIANLICGYSIYVLKTTSCGLPPGPLGLEGAAEGISYLAVIGIFGWSLTKKLQTGSGLPEGKYGLLGLAEGLSFLTVLAGVAVAGLNMMEYGFLPGFLPNDNCFGIND